MSGSQSKKIEITVSPEGATSIKTMGFSGSLCKAASRDLEKALGVAGREHLQPEYFHQGNTGEPHLPSQKSPPLIRTRARLLGLWCTSAGPDPVGRRGPHPVRGIARPMALPQALPYC